MTVLWRITLVLALPVILLWTVISTLATGLWDALHDTWRQLRSEIEAFARYWREADRWALDFKRAWKAGRTFYKLKRNSLNVGGRP